ncbi:MAG: hypothetical protein V5788_11910 [Shewanella sp.]
MAPSASGSSTEGYAMAVTASNGATLESNTVTIDDEGKAYIQIKSINEGDLIITVVYSQDGADTEASETVSFIGDIDTARVAELTVLENNAYPDGAETNTLTATALDRGDVVPDALLVVELNGSTRQS